MKTTDKQTKPVLSVAALVIIGAVIFVACVYILLPNHRYFTDGLTASHKIETSDSWSVHPNHPLMPLLPQIFLKLIAPGGEHPGLAVMFGWSMLFGVLSVAMLALLLKRAGLSTAGVVLGIFTFAFSSGVWYFNVTANQYSTAVALNILTLLYFQTILLRDGSRVGSKDAIFAGMLTAAAIMAHQVNGVLILPGLFVIYSRLGVSRHALISAAIYIVSVFTAALILFILFAIVFAGVGTVSEFFIWQKSYVTRPWYWAHGVGDSISRSFKGSTELHIAHIWHAEGLFGPSTGWPRWFLFRIMQLYVLLFIVIETIRALINWIRTRDKSASQNFGLLAWIPLVLFSFAFTPESTNYRIFYVPGFLMFVLPAIELSWFRVSPKSKLWIVPLLFVIFLFAGNLALKFIPGSNQAKNPYIYEARMLSNNFGEGDLIVYSGAAEDYMRADYALYFTGADTLLVPQIINSMREDPDAFINQVRMLIESGSHVAIHEDALYSEEDIEWLNRFYGMDIKPGELDELMSRHFISSGQFVINDKAYFIPELIPEH